MSEVEILTQISGQLAEHKELLSSIAQWLPYLAGIMVVNIVAITWKT